MHWKNLDLYSVKHGFGWSRSGDPSTHPISNLLDEIDKEVEKLKEENKHLKNASIPKSFKEYRYDRIQDVITKATGWANFEYNVRKLYNCIKEKK